MGAVVTLGPGAITGGSSLLDGLIATLYFADSVTVDTETHTAIAQTQPEDPPEGDGFDGKVTFSGTVDSPTDATINSFKLEFDGVEEISATGLDIDFQAMKTAIETADRDDQGQGPGIQPLVDILQGIDWTIDASAATKHVMAFGTGGDDHFTLTKFDDLLQRDGGDDIVDMGQGNDTVFFGNTYGFAADHKGHASVDGGKGSDTLALFLVNNEFLGDFSSVSTEVGLIFDLQNATVNLKGSDTLEFNHYYNFENVNGSEKGDTILGSKVANRLDGFDGNDEITGRGGKDVLIGGGGKDDFNYLAVADSATGKNHDVISDFEHKLDDIDFSKLHPGTKNDKFIFVGQDKLEHVGDLHFVLNDEKGKAHDTTLIEANLKGDAKPEIQIELTGLVHLDKGDFFL